MILPISMKVLHIGQSDVHFYLIQSACSKYHLFVISFEHYFFPTWSHALRLILSESTREMNYQFLHSGLCVTKTYFTNYWLWRAITAPKNMALKIWWNNGNSTILVMFRSCYWELPSETVFLLILNKSLKLCLNMYAHVEP